MKIKKRIKIIISIRANCLKVLTFFSNVMYNINRQYLF